MKRTLYIGLTVLCLASMATAAVAKGRPQQQPVQGSGQAIEQGNPQQQYPLAPEQGQYQLPQNGGQMNQQRPDSSCQAQSVNGQQQLGTQTANSSRSMPIRSNRGGLVRGRDRAQQVQQMNNLAKNQRGSGNSSMQQGRCFQQPQR